MHLQLLDTVTLAFPLFEDFSISGFLLLFQLSPRTILIWGWRQDPLSVLHSIEEPKLLLKPEKCIFLSEDITWLSLLLGTYQASLKDSLCLLWRPRIAEVSRAAETREPLKQNEER